MKRRKLRKKHPNFKSKLGEINESNNCGIMRIIEYNGNRNIKIKFKTNSIVKTNYVNFKKGTVKDPLFPSMYKIGCFGIGKYKANINNKNTIEYTTWADMIKRCYDPYNINKQLTYQEVTVCKEWLNFQNFAEWFHDNYYELENEKVELDKDIIKHGNKIYCPEYCGFVPQSINRLLVKKSKGICPIGVCFYKNKYKAQITINGKIKYIGCFTSSTEAFNAYKKEKEKHIKVIADKYKNVLDKKVYNSLIKYKILISD